MLLLLILFWLSQLSALTAFAVFFCIIYVGFGLLYLQVMWYIGML